MIDRSNLRLIKSNRHREHSRRPVEVIHPSLLKITPAEAAEMARFKALTTAKATRQQRVGQISAEVQPPDDTPPAA
jgi:hypothetical protein